MFQGQESHVFTVDPMDEQYRLQWALFPYTDWDQGPTSDITEAGVASQDAADAMSDLMRHLDSAIGGSRPADHGSLCRESVFTVHPSRAGSARPVHQRTAVAHRTTAALVGATSGRSRGAGAFDDVAAAERSHSWPPAAGTVPVRRGCHAAGPNGTDVNEW